MRKIQIWSNKVGNEFAIRLDRDIDFHAMTRPGEAYVKVVDETPFFEDMKYDWDYTLRSWIENGHTASSESFHLSHLNDNSNTASTITTQGKRNDRRHSRSSKSKWAKPTIKCHYCGLMFVNERGREDHGREWHAAKYGKSQ